MRSVAGLKKQVARLASRVPKTSKEEIDLSLMTAQERERFRSLIALCTTGRWFNIGALTDEQRIEARHLSSLLEALEANNTTDIARYRRRLAHTQEETEALFFALDIPEDTLLHTHQPANTYQRMKVCIRGKQGANQASTTVVSKLNSSSVSF